MSLRSSIACLPLLLGPALPAAAAGDWDGIAVDVSVQACADGAWTRSTTRGRPPALAAAAGAVYLVEADEDGLDIVLHGPATASDSAPGGHARELLFAQAAADGAVPATFEIADRIAPQPGLRVRLHCADRLHGERMPARLLAHAQRRLNDAEQGGLAAPQRAALRRDAAFAALAAAATTADAERAAQAWHQTGYLSLRLMQDALAAQAYAQAEADWGRAQRPVHAALALLGRARAELAQRLPVAAERMAAAERALRALDLQEDADIAAHDVCLALRFAERAADAAVCYGEAAARFADHDEAGLQADALVNQATALLYAGDAPASERAALASVDVARAIGDPTREALAFARLAATAAWRGELDRALVDYMRASHAVQQQGDGFWIAHFDIRIGETLELAGERARAAAYFRRAYDGVRALNARKAGDALRALARVEAAEGDLDAADRDLQAAQQAYAGAGNAPPALAYERIALALRRGEHETARALLATAPRGTEWQIEADLRLSELLLTAAEGGSAAALEPLQALLDEARRRGHARLRFATAAAVVRALADARQPDAAIALADAELGDGVRLVENVRAPGLRAAFAPALAELAMLRAQALLHAGAADGAVDRTLALQAIAPSEALRAAARQRAPTAAVPDAIAAVERLVGVQWGLGQVAAEGPQTLRELDAAALRLTASAVPAPVPAAPGTMPDAAPQPTLYFLPGETRTLALAFGADAVHWFELPAPAALAQRIAGLQRLLAEPASPLPDLAAAARALAADLRWTALLDGIGGDTVAVVADGVLADVPWALLPLQRAPRSDEAGAIVMALGYPPTLLDWNIVLGSRLAPAADPAATAGELHLLFSSAHAGAVAALRGEQREREAIAHALANAALTLRTHAPSTAGLVAALQQPAIVHIAAHGRADRQRTETAGVWLQDAGDRAPIFFSAGRLAATAVHARLIVLTACDSAGGRALVGQPVPGFAGSLLAAGAGAVVGHRWQVDDHAMAAFVEPFYRRLQHAIAPQAAARALRGAQLELLATRRYRHPYYWAGWLVAEGS